MGVVVIVGFSCTGKSTLVKKLQDDSDCIDIEFVDTDYEIAKNAGGHIYNLFIERGHQGAIEFVNDQEKQFLTDFTPSRKCVIAAGPLIPRRAEFGDFLTRVNGTCIWLTIRAEEAAERLVARQERIGKENPQLLSHPNFGSWNWPHLTERNEETLFYSLIADKEKRTTNTNLVIADFENSYNYHAGRNNRYYVGRPERLALAVQTIKHRALS